MTITAICVLSFLLLILVWKITRPSKTRFCSVREWQFEAGKVDLDAFRALTSTREEFFLRQSLPSRQYRQVQRARILLARQFVKAMGENAALLAALAGRSDPDPELNRTLQGLVSTALRVRLNAFVAEWFLLLKWAFPSLVLKRPIHLESYDDLLQQAHTIVPRLSPLRAATSS